MRPNAQQTLSGRITSVTVDDRGGISNIFSTLFHLKLAVMLLSESITKLSSITEQKRLYLAQPFVSTYS